MVSGMVRMIRYPFAAAIAASPIPVLPLVGSIMTEPSFNSPFFSASSIIAFAIRSFTLPAGLKYSSFTSIVAFKPSFFSILATSTSGVLPIRSSVLLKIFDMSLPSFFMTFLKLWVDFTPNHLSSQWVSMLFLSSSRSTSAPSPSFTILEYSSGNQCALGLHSNPACATISFISNFRKAFLLCLSRCTI